MLSVPAEASDNGCYPWARDVGLIWIGSPIGIPLEGMEHVPCESNGLIKWDQLDGHGFRVKYKRIWFLGGLGWNSSWQFMVKDGIRWGENVPLFNFNLDLFVRGKNSGWGPRHHSIFGCERVWHRRQGVEWHSAPSILLTWSGVDGPLCGGQQPRLAWDPFKPSWLMPQDAAC